MGSLLNIELRHVRYLLAAADHGSFRKAGLFLGVRESAISRAIRDLELQLGNNVFYRHTAGVTLSPMGQRLRNNLQTALHLIEEGFRDAATTQNASENCIKIGMHFPIASDAIFAIIQRFTNIFPEVNIVLKDGTQQELLGDIRSQHVDLAIVSGSLDCNDCVFEPLWSESRILALASNHWLASINEIHSIDLKDGYFLADLNWQGSEIYNYLISLTERIKCTHPVHTIHHSHKHLLSLVAAGEGITVVGGFIAAKGYPGVVFREVADERLTYQAIWPKEAEKVMRERLMQFTKAEIGENFV